MSRPADHPPRAWAFAAETGMAPVRLGCRRSGARGPAAAGGQRPASRDVARTGLGSAANLRLHLARDAGTIPTAYQAA